MAAEAPEHLSVLADELLALSLPAPSYGSDRARWERNAKGVIARIFRLGSASGWDKAVAAADGSGLEHAVPVALAVRSREAIETLGDDAPLALKQLWGHLLPAETEPPREPGPSGSAEISEAESGQLSRQLAEVADLADRMLRLSARPGYSRRVALAELSRASGVLESASGALREA